jgi:hypothetical protein
LDEKSDGRLPGTEDGLKTRATLPADGRHFNDIAVCINRHYRNNSVVREVDMVEGTISLHQDLFALAADLFKLRHKPLEVARWQGEQKPIAGQI